MKKILSVLFLTTIAVSLSAQPSYFNYQGLLKDSNGDPLENGSYSMEFNIYDSALNGTLLWGPFILDDGVSEGHSKSAQITNGQFNVILGPTDTGGQTLSDVFGGNSAYVELSVNGGDPILPRQRILSTPYAFSSTTATTLAYLPPVQYRNPAGMLVPFAGTSDKIPDGWLLCDGREFNTSDYPELYDVIGQSWGGRQEVDGETVTNYFNIPDLRSMFLRGANLGRDDGFKDPNAASREDGTGTPSEDAGSHQTDRDTEHRHIWANSDGGANEMDSWQSNGNQYLFLDRTGTLQISEVALNDFDYEDNYNDIRGTQNLYTKPGSTTNDTVDPVESRPNNAAVNYIIKL